MRFSSSSKLAPLEGGDMYPGRAALVLHGLPMLCIASSTNWLLLNYF